MTAPRPDGAPAAQAEPDGAPAAARRRAALADDPQRPRYHFLPPDGWMNDPNGLLHWRGRYHLFYQHNAVEARWGDICWGHAVSSDLVHWHDLPPALTPTPDGPDAFGCWSGCAFDADGVPTLLYTGASTGFGTDEQRPCLAVSHDGLHTFDKHPGNPVISSTPAGLDLVGFRDHAVWREDGHWYQIVGSGIRGRGGAVLLYRSPDLLDWQYLHPLCDPGPDIGAGAGAGAPLWTGRMWECPNFFPLGDRHALVVSVCAEDPVTFYYPAYLTGAYKGTRFVPTRAGLLDLGGHTDVPDLPADHPRRLAPVGMRGGHLYAPQVFGDDQGRRLMIGWIMEGRDEAAQLAAGWAGVMSLPRVLTCGPDGAVGVEPVPELTRLRLPGRRWAGFEVADTASGTLGPDAGGDTVELRVRLQLNGARGGGVVVRRSPDGAEQTTILYDHTRGRLEVRRDRSSTTADPYSLDTRGGPFRLAPGEQLDLRVFLDRSVVEVFANGRAGLTTRIYPARPDSLGIDVFAEGGTATVTSLELWPLRPVW